MLRSPRRSQNADDSLHVVAYTQTQPGVDSCGKLHNTIPSTSCRHTTVAGVRKRAAAPIVVVRRRLLTAQRVRVVRLVDAIIALCTAFCCSVR